MRLHHAPTTHVEIECRSRGRIWESGTSGARESCARVRAVRTPLRTTKLDQRSMCPCLHWHTPKYCTALDLWRTSASQDRGARAVCYTVSELVVRTVPREGWSVRVRVTSPCTATCYGGAMMTITRMTVSSDDGASSISPSIGCEQLSMDAARVTHRGRSAARAPTNCLLETQHLATTGRSSPRPLPFLRLAQSHPHSGASPLRTQWTGVRDFLGIKPPTGSIRPSRDVHALLHEESQCRQGYCPMTLLDARHRCPLHGLLAGWTSTSLPATSDSA